MKQLVWFFVNKLITPHRVRHGENVRHLYECRCAPSIRENCFCHKTTKIFNWKDLCIWHIHLTKKNSSVFFPFAGECGCGCVDSSSSVVITSSGPISTTSDGSKMAHKKVATSGSHANTQAPSKRSSSGADGDYQLVQHEVLYSLSAEYEVNKEAQKSFKQHLEN